MEEKETQKTISYKLFNISYISKQNNFLKNHSKSNIKRF